MQARSRRARNPVTVRVSWGSRCSAGSASCCTATCPGVLHHGRWPHGEDWLFEAAAETWLPLLEVLQTCADEGNRPGLDARPHPESCSSSSRPTGSATGSTGSGRAGAARADDAAEFDGVGDASSRASPAGVGRAVPAARGRVPGGRAGPRRAVRRPRERRRIEWILSSNATHGYHPLILHDACGRAQVRAGLATSERHLGFRPRGVWLPECAYRPPGTWWPPAVHGLPREVPAPGRCSPRRASGSSSSTPTSSGTRAPRPPVAGGRSVPVDPLQPEWDVLRAWNSELEPHGLVERAACAARRCSARCPEVARAGLERQIGYPGDAAVPRVPQAARAGGLRYWRVTWRRGRFGRQAAVPAGRRRGRGRHAGPALLRARQARC